MASKKQRIESAKKRDKRSKILLIGGAVVLLAVGAYEVPTIMKMMSQKPPPGTTYDPGPSSSVPGSALPNVAAPTGAAPAAPAASKGDLVDTDVPLASTAGQLVTFEVFETKNPFKPQVTTSQPSSSAAVTNANKSGADVPSLPSGATASLPSLPTLPGGAAASLPTLPTLPGGSTGTSAGVVPSNTVPSTTVPSTTTPTTTTTAPTGTTTTTTAATAPTVSISVNGTVSRVSTNATFPTGAPVFRLAGFTHGTAQIGIVGGSYQAGGATLTLHQGQAVTLQNTTDGKRYTIELLSTP